MFKDHQTHKCKMSQGEEGGGEEGNEVHLGLPCGRQKDSSFTYHFAAADHW